MPAGTGIAGITTEAAAGNTGTQKFFEAIRKGGFFYK